MTKLVYVIGGLRQTLWSIPDAPTALLMKQFYENLKHYDKAQALCQAMLKTLEKAAHFRNWAAFTLIGEAFVN